MSLVLVLQHWAVMLPVLLIRKQCLACPQLAYIRNIRNTVKRKAGIGSWGLSGQLFLLHVAITRMRALPGCCGT